VKVFIETFGCWLNKGESDIMKTLLRERGHEVVDTPEKADTVIVNTCAVRGDTETKIFRELTRLEALRKKTGFRLVVTGCLTNVRPKSILEIAPEASLVEPDSLERIVEVVESEKQLLLLRSYPRMRNVLPEFEGGVTYILPVQSGCLGACSFCIEWVTRGLGVKSYPLDSIVKAVENAVKKGAKEVYLVGQDLATYGYDLGTNLTALIEEILQTVKGEYRIRIGMMEPMLLRSQIDGLLTLARDERLYKYFHIPVQSGDDNVLKLMNRKYTVSEYRDLVGRIRSQGLSSSIATDIIVGFPGEDENAFNNTLRLLGELMFDKVHIARYTLRPFTKGYLMKGPPEPLKKLRSKIATELSFRIAYEINRKYLGMTKEVLINSVSMRGDFTGRTPEYKPVVFKDYDLELGAFVKARIVDASPLHLVGEVVD
jgi:MiaB/RimO family radical SAM methylthiotransferase